MVQAVTERRVPGKYTERLSSFMVAVAAIGAGIVLLDVKVTLTIWGQVIQLGGAGFSADLKGAVIASILISGYTAVKEYWLGASATGQNQSESMSRIAEASAPVAAAAAAAASATPSGTIKADDVKIDATGTVNVNAEKP